MLKIYDLRTEYLENPLGIDAKQPRFSWKLKSTEKNIMQKFYHLIASYDKQGNNVIWDSGKVEGEDSQQILWCGAKLKSMEKIYWRVRVWAGEELVESEIASFEMGLLEVADWKAKWIEPEEDLKIDNRMPSPYLRKEFKVDSGLKQARIYQSAHGLYEFWVNNEKGTEDVFKPGFTSYYNRIQYQTYDITSMLKEGINCWAVVLGDGWWRGLTGGFYRNNFGYKVSFIGQIVLEYEDGSIQYVVSDEAFKTSTGGLLQSDMKEGDIYDANKEPVGWKLQGYDDSLWKNVHLEKDGYEHIHTLIPSRSVPIKEKEVFLPKVLRTPNGEVVLDFGQNIAGYVRMRLRGGKPGQKVTLVHGEALDEDGNFTLKNLIIDQPNARLQTVEYIMKGIGEEYCPMFSIFGFQYVLLKGYMEEILPGDFIAVAVYSDMEETGVFRCSNSLINKLVDNSRWSQKGNFLDVPTDCPTRERSPWSGDSQIYVRTASDFMNVYSFFEKWLQDLSLEQFSSGKVANTIPATAAIHNPEELKRKLEQVEMIPEGMTKLILKMTLGDSENGGIVDGSAGWGDTAVITPYVLYLCYGDKRILENQYNSAKKWVDYIIKEAKKTNPVYRELEYYNNSADSSYVWDTGYHWGEWVEPDIDLGNEGTIMNLYNYPDYNTATMYYFYSSKLLSKMAGILGKKDEEEKYRSISDNVKRVFNKYFIYDDGTIKEGRQAPNVRALAFGLVDDSKKKSVANKLEELVRNNSYKLNTGFLATPYLLKVLVDCGNIDAAFKILEQTESPNWLFNVKAGATTILEKFNGFEKCSGSFNHYSLGAVCNFLFEYVAGIRPEIEHPGYKHFILKPTTGGTLTDAYSEFESIYGTIRSSWKKINNNIEYEFMVPVNTSATIYIYAQKQEFYKIKKEYKNAEYIDGNICIAVGSGKWNITIEEK